MKYQLNTFIAFISISTLLLICTTAQSENINIDFGNTTEISEFLSNTFAGAANQPGTWNRVVDFSGSSLIDINGVSTDVNYSISAEYMHGWQGGGIPEGNILVNDNFWTYAPNSWSVSFSGLNAGTYDIYYYGPRNDHVQSGTLLVNGVLAYNVDGGEYSGSFVKGVHYDKVQAVVDNSGILLFSSTNNEAIGQVVGQGLAGLQITVVPEPISAILFITGGSLLVGQRYIKRRNGA